VITKRENTKARYCHVMDHAGHTTGYLPGLEVSRDLAVEPDGERRYDEEHSFS